MTGASCGGCGLRVASTPRAGDRGGNIRLALAAGAALASLAVGLSTGYAAAAQGTVDDPLADMVAYEALGLETFSFVSETDGP